MNEILKYISAAVFGGGVAYGALRQEIASLKESVKLYQPYGERLAAIESKIDLLISLKRNNETYLN
jgi:hypothetical protein